MKDKIIQELQKRTKEHGIVKSDLFTAVDLATFLKTSRNTVSQYLNDYVKAKQVIKINTRPVYFFTKKELESNYNKHCDIESFDSIDELYHYFVSEKKDFEKLIGYDNSLKTVVEHCKAAVSYPGSGLPILINGPTGTGKSMIANLLFEYAVHQKIISDKKTLISVNCSEYANNPELLTANLFGHVKGAYTGADEDSSGLIALADGGMLFLDEVHCLKAECQEKLFFFMDKGMYHKVGDNANWYKSKSRLIFATTEDPQNVLLKTLLRRIPITVSVPSLKDRPLIEKRLLIFSIFEREELRLGVEILLSNMAYQTLMDFEFIGNVGSLKNVIKATCANAFLSKSNQDDKLNIHIFDLPDYVFKPITTLQVKIGEGIQETMIPLNHLEKSTSASAPLLHLYDKVLHLYDNYVLTNESFDEFVEAFKKIMQSYIDYVIFKNRYRKNANDDFLLKILDKIYSIVMNKYSLNVPNNEIQVYAKILSEYTKYVMDAKVWNSSHKDSIDNLILMLQDKAPREFNIAKEVANNVALNLDLELDDLMFSIIVFAFISYERQCISSSVGVILCHGYSTASSIADTANRLLGEYIFDGIDMQIDLSIDKLVMLVDEYLKRKNSIEELMLLVDMGSLEAIYKRIKPIANCNIGLMNNVSTKMALEVGSSIKQGKCILEIMEHIQKEYTLSTHYIEGKVLKSAILTICATGFGAAQKISELLLNSLPYKIPLEIIPYEYQSLVENGIQDTIFNRYQVDLAIGTLDPEVNGLDFIPVEELIIYKGVGKLEQIIADYLKPNEVEKFRQNIMKNFTLSNIVNHLTILNAEKIIDDVEEIVDILEEESKIVLDATRKTGLFVHISCLIERLILKNEISEVEGMDEEIKKHQDFITIAKLAFSGVEMRYSVEVPDAEIIYILNYFQNV
ncbi:MAG: sigma 54-interacting transcriptional regulator [Erysipelotrichaceae bacterium]